MTYEELVLNVRKAMKKAKVSKTIGHVAFQFNIEGEAEGAFYIELSDGKINVEPYEYYDRDVIITTLADTLIQMVEGKLNPRAASTQGLLKVYGNEELLDMLPFGCETKKRQNRS